MKKIIIGVMGPGEGATQINLDHAYQLGKLIAEGGWVLLTGGRNTGVMEAANQGAKAANGLTLGILPHASKKGVSDAVDLAIFTNLNQARNVINILSSDVVIACGIGAGTASEIALTIKHNKPVILLNQMSESHIFFKSLSPEQVIIVNSPEEAIQEVRNYLTEFS